MGGGIFCCLYFSIFGYYSVLFQFTTIAALCGLGATLLLGISSTDKIWRYLTFIILLFFADTIRPKIGYLTTGAIIASFALLYLLNKKAKFRYVITAIVVQIFVYIVNAVYEYLNGWSDFRKYHLARSNWTDYPHPSFQESASLYESIGWTDKLYNIAGSWFFMDRRINMDSFITLNLAEKQTDLSFVSKMFAAYKLIVSVPQLRMGIFILSFLILLTTALLIRKHDIKSMIAILMAGFISVSLMLYFAYHGRLPYRVSYSILILYMLPVLFFLYEGNFHIDRIQKDTWCVFAVWVAVTVIAGYSFWNADGLMQTTRAISTYHEKVNAMKIKNEIETYAVEHPENIYIYDISLALAGDPFATYSNGKPYNLTFWGGSGMYSPTYYDQLAANGLEELYSDQFFDENIYFMGATEPNMSLVEYMKEEFDEEIQADIVDVKNGFIVYRFNKKNGCKGE